MPTPYEALLARLLPARRFGMVFGLERIRALLDRLGSPDRELGTIVHIGGTNGKGSTVAMLAALCRDRRVAAYTSPHLSSLRERIAIDGAAITEDALVAAADRVYAAGVDDLTFFEQITAIACVAIAAARVDITILEVGLGGRLDATNAIPAPISVVTGVALDHEAILGSTLDAIAREKAGIFKPGQRIVIGASGEPAAVPTLVAAARAVGAAALAIVDDAAIAAVPQVALPGAHQRRNAAAAIAAAQYLVELGAIAAPRLDALATVLHPGRFERVGDVILDGAHNPQGATALAATLREQRIHPTLVLAVSSDKDVHAMIAALAPAVRGIIATRYQQERAMPPNELATAVREVLARPDIGHASPDAGHASPDAGHASPDARTVLAAPDLAAALAAAHALGPGPVVVAGSLFLVGEARVLLLGAPADPFLVTDPSVRR